MQSNSESALNIIKQAIFLEIQGRAFYSKVAEQCGQEGLADIFRTMAKEEESHIEYLTNYSNAYKNNGAFPEQSNIGPGPELADTVLSEEIKKSISAASYEAAAVSAAIEMEKKAVALYQDRAKKTDSTSEKELYERLAKWELTHLDVLTDLNDSIVEAAWNENGFWPF
jgi:rubrerythrin